MLVNSALAVVGVLLGGPLTRWEDVVWISCLSVWMILAWVYRRDAEAWRSRAALAMLLRGRDR